MTVFDPPFRADQTDRPLPETKLAGTADPRHPSRTPVDRSPRLRRAGARRPTLRGHAEKVQRPRHAQPMPLAGAKTHWKRTPNEAGRVQSTRLAHAQSRREPAHDAPFERPWSNALPTCSVPASQPSSMPAGSLRSSGSVEVVAEALAKTRLPWRPPKAPLFVRFFSRSAVENCAPPASAHPIERVLPQFAGCILANFGRRSWRIRALVRVRSRFESSSRKVWPSCSR